MVIILSLVFAVGYIFWNSLTQFYGEFVVVFTSCLFLQVEDVLMIHNIEMTRVMAVMTMIAMAQSSELRNSTGLGVVVVGLGHVELSKSTMKARALWNLALLRAL